MKSRLLFRESGLPIRTRWGADGSSSWLWIALALIVVVGLLGMGASIDDSDGLSADIFEQTERAALQRAFESGRRQGHAEMVGTAQAAWSAAHVEADRVRDCPRTEMPK